MRGRNGRTRGPRRTFLLSAIAVAGTALAGAGSANAGSAGAASDLAPAFSLPGPDGASVRLADYRGDVVYVDFWASWCPPCLQSFPWMNDVATRLAADGLHVVAINLDADRDAAERFLAGTRADVDVAFDPDGATAEAYGLIGMPSSYVIGRDGRVVHAHVGFRHKDVPALEAAIARALAVEAPGAVNLAEAER